MASGTRRRTGGGPGPLQWLALGGAMLIMLGLTFALGLLVGRQWARQGTSTHIAAAVEPARKPTTPSRRSGIAAETMADRAPESTEKLTFYQTLTEPLDEPAAAARSEAKPVAVKIPSATPPAAAPPSLPPASEKPAPVPQDDHASWTIQVGAYKNRGQADESRRQLRAAGLDAYVVTLAAREGVARYRVRIGTFRTREEAVTAAEGLRARRSLATFVTPK